MNKICINQWYFGYLILMWKIFQLLNNGESGKLTGIYLLMVITGVFFLIGINNIKMEGNKYITSFIVGFVFFFIEYSSYRDLNKRFNIGVIAYLILLLIIQMTILIFREIKRKKWKSKNQEQMKKIIKNMPMIDLVEIIEEKNSDQYNDDFDIKKFSNEIDQVINISVKYSVNGEGLNSLIKNVKNYLKLVGDEKKTTRIYITDRYAYYKPIRVYEIKNDVTKIRYIRENVQYTDSSFTDLFLDIVKVLKGKSDFNNTAGEYYE